jgi:hypothetical protein
MTAPHRFAIAVLYTLLAILPTESRAADILQNVPNDALGFVVVKNLDATDVKVDQLLKTLSLGYPSPLVFLKAATGIDEGLDPQGDLLIAALPSDDPNAGLQYSVWLPVADYDRMLKALDATPDDGISAVRVADEDLLIAHHGKWALVMDPDQRPRMENILSAAANPPEVVARWKTWIDVNEVSVIVLREGILDGLRWAAQRPPGLDPDEEPADDLFGDANDAADDDHIVFAEGEQAPNPLSAPIHRALHKWIVGSPRLVNLLANTDAIGCGARLDETGNGIVSMRLKANNLDSGASNLAATAQLPPALYEQGDFILNGAGRVPPKLMAAAAGAYARKMLNDLATDEHIIVKGANAQEFQKAYETAASKIESWSVVTQPGDQKTGIYNNNFLVVRSTSAQSFIEHVDDVVRLWNKMHRESEGDARYVFDIDDTKVAGHPGDSARARCRQHGKHACGARTSPDHGKILRPRWQNALLGRRDRRSHSSPCRRYAGTGSRRRASARSQAAD